MFAGAIVFSLFISFVAIQYGPGWDVDEYYMALRVRDYVNSPLGVLTFYIGDVWQRVFGYSILNLRILCHICVLLSIWIAVAYYWVRTRRLRMASLLLIFCSIVGRISYDYFYDWNCSSLPVVVVALIITLEYLRSPRLKLAVFMGVTLSLMTLLRVPSVVALPCVMLLMILCYRKETPRVYYHCGVVIQSFVAVWLLVNFIVLGPFSNWAACYNSNNVITGHSGLMPYILGVNRVWLKSPAQGVLLLLVLFFADWIQRVNGSRLLTTLLWAAVLGILVMFCRSLWGDWIFTFLAGLALFGIALYKNLMDRDSLMSVLVIILFAFVPAVGSDIILHRIMVCSLFPILFLMPGFNERTIKNWMVLGSLVSLFFLRLTFVMMVDGEYYALAEYPTQSSLMQTKERVDFKREMIEDIKSNVPTIDDMIVIGQGKYYLTYTITDGVGYNDNFYHYFNLYGGENVDPKMMEEMKVKDYVVIAASLPGEIDGYVLNREAIETAGFKPIVQKDMYAIYKRE